MTIDVRDVAYMASMELERRKRKQVMEHSVITSWRDWVGKLFPHYVTESFADHHEQALSWFWNIGPTQPRPFVMILARGGGKSTMAEIGITMAGALKKRRYCLYVRATQEQADKSVANLSTMLESSTIEQHYPDFGAREVGKYGQSRGWNRQRLRTASGFFIDALGLDTAMRGAKIEDARPDLIILDDIDELHDGPNITQKKIEQITLTLLPASTHNVAIFAIQNLLIRDGVFARLANGTADFLTDRRVIGPIPAVYDLTYESLQDPDTNVFKYRVTGGTPSWSGQDLERVESQINTWGLTSFLKEGQHNVDISKGGRFEYVNIPYVTPAQLPPLAKIVCWVDPAVTATDRSDSQAVTVVGKGNDDNIYVLYAWESRALPIEIITRALRVATEWGSPIVGVETDQGGETWRSVYKQVCDTLEKTEGWKRFPRFRYAKAGSTHLSKFDRVERALLPRYEEGSIYHILGPTAMLEPALRRFGVSKPYDLVDSLSWSVLDLDGGIRHSAGTWGKKSHASTT